MPLPKDLASSGVAAIVTLIVENAHEKHLELYLEGAGANGARRTPVGAVGPGEAKELNASPGQVYRIPEPNGNVVRKHTVKPSPKRQRLVLKDNKVTTAKAEF